MAREPELVVHRVRFLAPEAHPIHRVAFSGENIPRLAVSRADSSIEIWASTDGAGYYKRGLIPGRRDVSAESLVWSGKRLFSAGLTGPLEGGVAAIVYPLVGVARGNPTHSAPPALLYCCARLFHTAISDTAHVYIVSKR